MRPHSLGWIVATIAALVLPHPSAAAQRHAPQDLGALPGGSVVVPMAMNDRGQIVGYEYVGTPPSGQTHAFFWNRGAQFDLGPVVTFGDVFGVLVAINNHGEIAYTRRASPADPPRAALYKDGVSIDIEPLPGDHFSRAWAINDHGDVVATSYGIDGTDPEILLWSQGVKTDLGIFGVPLGITDRGDVVGIRFGGSGFDAFVWHAGSTTALGSLGGGPCQPRAFNGHGDVVGYCDVADVGTHAVLWRGGQTIDLTPGAVSAVAVAVNEQGRIAVLSDERAFVWEDGVMIPIDLPGTTVPVAVGDHGQVIGTSFDGSNGRVFVWDDGALTDLEPLPGWFPGGAVAVNHRGDVVGICNSGPTGQDLRGVLWPWVAASAKPLALVAASGSRATASDGTLDFALDAAMPNPSRGIDVSFALTSGSPATLSVFDLGGRQVAAREVGSWGPGRHRVSLAASGTLPPGVYMVRLAQDGRALTMRAVLLP